MSELHRKLVEYMAAGLFVIGILVSVIVPSAVISYMIMILYGFFVGRVVYRIEHKEKMPYILIMGGFLVGLLLGIYYGSRLVALVFFVAGALTGHGAYKKGFLKDSSF